MTINVYAWPPVGAVGSEWTVSDPVERSASIITGAEYLSKSQRRRRLATLRVSALAAGGMGAGYSESLKVLLQGGIHAVRLKSYPINWHVDALLEAPTRQALPLEWSADGADLEWSRGGPRLYWDTGALIIGTTGTDAAGFPIVTATGLPPNTLVARPSEFITLFTDDDDTVGTTVRILTSAVSDGTGKAVIRLHSDPGGFSGVRVDIGTAETGVFRANSMVRSVQPLGQDWFYTWEFTEVFSEEVGGFLEIDPW
ncbi:hypothetical protein [Salipiger thiooxidans]|uniref:hypothetical protein n=1 Tax=Salipiger thiooxidans TaxID=282683 RepID=UPI001CD32B66|nr:hypothetical protein [Salipiger thiooxidans]MCA0848342.1 hypothetical protein [Salipiger thiooxidans]